MSYLQSDLESAYEQCQTITRREAKNFYYAFLTLPAERRHAIYVIYAFCRYCDDAVDNESPSETTETKLAWLLEIRADLEGSFAGSAKTPLFLALHDVANRYDIPLEHFQDIVSGVQSDLVKNRYQNFPELREYCYQVASVVGLICLQIFGYKDPRAKEQMFSIS